MAFSGLTCLVVCKQTSLLTLNLEAACKELGIALIWANSAQAKGRVERMNIFSMIGTHLSDEPKLLRGESSVLSLLKTNPFLDKPPQFIRAELYEYHFAFKNDPSGAFWTRKWVREYLPPSMLVKPEIHKDT